MYPFLLLPALPVWLLALSMVSLGRCDVYTRFYVERSTSKLGTCAAVDMAAIYEEVLDMATLAVAAISNYENDPVVRAHVQTYLGITEDNIALLSQVNSKSAAFLVIIH